MKKLLAILLAGSLLLALAACGGGGNAGSTSAAEPASTAEPADTGEPADNGGGEAPAANGEDPFPIEEGASLVYWSMWGEAEPQGIVIKEAIEAFTAATGVEIEATYGSRATRDTLEPALQGGETIDIFDEDVERVQNTWGEWLLPLDDYINATYPETGGQPYKSVVNNTLMDLAAELGGGTTNIVPYQPSAFVMMYNKGLFEKAGIDAVPTTWDEFLEVCEKLKAIDITAMTIDDAYLAATFGYTIDRIAGKDAAYSMAATRDFSHPSVLRFGEVWEEMATKGYVSQKAASNVFPAGQNDEFAKETVAIMLNGTWLPNEVKDMAPDIDYGSFAMPQIDPEGDGAESNNFGAQSFGINKDTLYPNAAFAFIRWMTLGEWDQKLATDSTGVPMANDAEWPAQLADAKAVLDGTTNRLNWAVDMENDPEVNAAIRTNFAKLITGELNAQGFADAMAATPAA